MYVNVHVYINKNYNYSVEWTQFIILVCIVSDLFQGEIYSPSFSILLWSISINRLHSIRHDVAHRASTFFFLLKNRTFTIFNSMYW